MKTMETISRRLTCVLALVGLAAAVQARPLDEIKKEGTRDLGVGSAGPPPIEEHVEHQNRTLWGDAWYRLRRNKLALRQPRT